MYVFRRKENNTPTYICAISPDGSLNRSHCAADFASRGRMAHTLLDARKNNDDSRRAKPENVDVPYLWTFIVSLLKQAKELLKNGW